jgi:hypothetical protein
VERFSSCLANPFVSRVERVIPILMADWSEAWDLVRGRVAVADVAKGERAKKRAHQLDAVASRS